MWTAPRGFTVAAEVHLHSLFPSGSYPTTAFSASLPVQASEMVSEQRGVSRHSNASSDEAARMECAIYAALGAQLPGMLPVRSPPSAAMAAQL